MDCEEFFEDYSDFFDWRLEEHSLADYRQHLSDCPTCREYDRVMRSGLHLIKDLEPPPSHSDIVSRVQDKISALHSRLGQRTGEMGRALAVSAATAIVVLLITSMPVFQPSRSTVELPPVVVDRGPHQSARPSVFGPAPRFRSSMSVLRAEPVGQTGLLATPPERISLFRTPLGRTSRESPPAAPVAQ
jgi:hypothetical protein